MKLLRLVVPTLAGLMMAIGVVVAVAANSRAPSSPPPFKASETNLMPSGSAEDIHADAAGNLWITEVQSKTIRELNPATRAYTLYTGLTNPHDAQVGPDGRLWWLEDFPQAVARMDIASRLVTTWPVTTFAGAALAFDSSQRAWFVDALLSGVYRFDPNNGNQFCDYALPGGGGGPFISEHNGALWVGDIVSRTLGRITPTVGLNAAYTYWPLSFGGGFPEPSDVTFAPGGGVWWADSGLGKIGFLQPATNRMMLFGPPGVSAPQQVDYQGGKVWFTDPFTQSIGVINPATAVGLGPYVVTPTMTTLVPDCAGVGNGSNFTAGMLTGLAGFSPLVLTGTVNAEGNLYQVPAGGMPWGLQSAGFDVWVTDVGRDKLIRLDTALRIYLPTIRR